MFFLLPLIYCEASVVKIVQRENGGQAVALSVDGGRVEMTQDLGDLRTDFLLRKLSSTHDPLVEISPVLQQNKKLSIDRGRAVILVHNDDDDRKWRVKKEGTRHKLMVGRMCLAVRRGVVSAEDCEDHSPGQLFMIAAQEDAEESEYRTSSESVYEIHQAPKRIYSEILSEDSDYSQRPEPVLRGQETDADEETPRVNLTVTNVRVVTVTRTVKDRPRPGENGRRGQRDEDEPRTTDHRGPRPWDTSPWRQRKQHSDVMARGGAPFERSVSGSGEGDSWMREKRTKQGEIERLQRFICDKMDNESDSSSSDGLLGLIKAFGDDKRESDFIDIRTPSMFGKKDEA